MKTLSTLTGVLVVAFCATLPSLAQQTNLDDRSGDRDAWLNHQEHLGKVEKASQLLGMEATDDQGQKLGKVKDLAIDLQNGRIVEVILGTGGFLGAEERFVAVPPSQFTCDPAQNKLQLSAQKESLRTSPVFELSKWEANTTQGNVAEVYQFYHAKPYFAADGQSPRNESSQSLKLGELYRAGKLIGDTARNLQNERVGKVENLIVDLRAGRVVEVIVESGGFLGMGEELSAVPPQTFRAGDRPGTLVLDTTREALANAPHFKKSEWPDMNNQEHVVQVYQSYHVEPYFSTNAADNTAQNVRDRSDSTLTPLSQGNSEADVDTSRQIRKQIMDADGLSVNAQNVKVITVDGRVTLRGPVNSEEEKQRIVEIATRVASPANVDNQLQVENPLPVNSPK